MAAATKTWEVRSMAQADAEAAVQAARRAKQTTAEWLTDAIREKVARERVEQVELGEVGEVMPPSNGRALTVVAPAPPPSDVSPADLVQDLEAYERIMRLRGKEISPRAKVLVGVERLVRARLMATVPPSPPRSPRRRRDAARKRQDENAAASGQVAESVELEG